MAFGVCFLLTILMAYLSQYFFKQKQKILGILFAFLCILIPSILAGIRDLDVGRDVFSYVSPAVNRAIDSNFTTYMTSLDLEWFYKIIIYLAVLVNPSVHFSLFVLQFLTILFVYLFAYKNRKKQSISFIIAIYMIAWYCYSYTFMRQSLAVAMIIYSTTLFQDKKYFKTFLLFLLSIGVHKTALLGIFVYIFLFISKNFKKKKLLYIMYIMALAFGVLFFNQIMYLTTHIIKILPMKYFEYTQFYFAGNDDVSTLELIYKLFWIGIALLYLHQFRHKKIQKDIQIDVILLLLLTDFAAYILSYKIVNLGRVGLYFSYLALFKLLPNIKYFFKQDKINGLVANSLVISVLLVLWVWNFPIHNWSETYPYHSEILPILND